MRTRIAACAAAAVIILLGIQPGMAASCERIFSLYSSGVTPKTKTALSGENALAISLHKNGGCGWGTANGQSSLAAAEATALAKCRAFPLNMECKIAGRNGKIIASLSQITKHASTEKPKAVKEVADAPHAGPDITPGEEAGHPQQIPGHANTPKSPPTEMLSTDTRANGYSVCNRTDPGRKDGWARSATTCSKSGGCHRRRCPFRAALTIEERHLDCGCARYSTKLVCSHPNCCARYGAKLDCNRADPHRRDGWARSARTRPPHPPRSECCHRKQRPSRAA